MDHPGLFRPWFDGTSWNPWRAVTKAAYGLPMSDDDAAFLRQVANRAPPKRRVREIWHIIGRRGGEDSIVSSMATQAAASFDPVGILRPGERAAVVCIACDRTQAQIISSAWSHARSRATASSS